MAKTSRTVSFDIEGEEYAVVLMNQASFLVREEMLSSAGLTQ